MCSIHNDVFHTYIMMCNNLCSPSTGDWVKSCVRKSYYEPGGEFQAVCSDSNPPNSVARINVGLCRDNDNPITSVNGVLLCTPTDPLDATSAVRSDLPSKYWFQVTDFLLIGSSSGCHAS